jgi:hypothetical protein
MRRALVDVSLDPRQIFFGASAGVVEKMGPKIIGEPLAARSEKIDDCGFCDVWNLKQEIAHAQKHLSMTNKMNAQLESALEDWEGIEELLEQQKQINEPLRSRYIRMRWTEG